MRLRSDPTLPLAAAGRPRGRLPAGDPRALGALLDDLRPRLRAVAHRFTGDRQTAEDVVQNAFEKALRYGHRFRGEARVSTWLHRIVANEALMALRGERRRARLASAVAESLALAPPSSADPLEQLSRAERAGGLRAALAALAPEEREVLVHCALREESYRDFAARRGLHPAAVKSRAFRARGRLGRVLADASGRLDSGTLRPRWGTRPSPAGRRCCPRRSPSSSPSPPAR